MTSRKPLGEPQPRCLVEGCERDARTKGLCAPHFLKEWRRQNPEYQRAWMAANPGYQKRWYADNIDAAREHGRRGMHKRRARRYAAPTEDFDHLEIFERDRWRCGLCGELVDRALGHPDPMSASLDHIVPLALGGAHVRANVHLAHLVCNVRKRTRAMGEQLRLIG